MPKLLLILLLLMRTGGVQSALTGLSDLLAKEWFDSVPESSIGTVVIVLALVRVTCCRMVVVFVSKKMRLVGCIQSAFLSN